MREAQTHPAIPLYLPPPPKGLAIPPKYQPGQREIFEHVEIHRELTPEQ